MAKVNQKKDKRLEIIEKMNAAALEAEKDWNRNVDKKVRAATTEFFKKWYMKAGYKKLGKMILGKEFITEIE